MECPKELYVLAAKRIFRYYQGTIEFGCFYTMGEMSNLYGFTENDYAEDSDDWKRIFGYVFMLDLGYISWSSKKQSIIALLNIEAEFVVAMTCACPTISLRKILEDIHFKQLGHTQFIATTVR